MRLSGSILCAGLVGFTLAARAEPKPLTSPTRDVDVTYRMVQPDAPGGPRVLEQRMRWGVTQGKLRVDPPSPGLYLIMDTKTRRLDTIREAERVVIELDAAGAGLGTPGAAPGGGAGTFVRRGAATIAGLSCTDWETRDTAGEAAQICLTADGVLLRAASGGRVLVEASKIAYTAIDDSAFRIPEGFRVIVPPAPPK